MASVSDIVPDAAAESGRCVHIQGERGRHLHGLVSSITSHATNHRQVKAGNDLFRIGEPCEAVYLVTSGWICLYDLLPNGRRQILQFVLPGALLGFNPDSHPVAVFGAEALTDATVCSISDSTLALLWKSHPEIGMMFAKQIASDRNLSFDHLTSIGRRPARERVARLLLELFVRYGAQWPAHQTEEMLLPLTQEHIADATGLTCVHVNRVLADLCGEGIVEFHYRKLTIRDSDKLVEVAAIDPRLMVTWMPKGSFKS